jgi:hypothetical protein
MKKTLLIMVPLALMALAGCNSGPAHPEEAEVKAELAGSYCSETPRYRVEISAAGRYEARRNNKSVFATSRIGEKCEGNIKLGYDDEKHLWTATLEKADKYSNPFVSCPGASVVVWEAEKGYAKAGEFIKMVEPFDQTEIVKDCGVAQ